MSWFALMRNLLTWSKATTTSAAKKKGSPLMSLCRGVSRIQIPVLAKILGAYSSILLSASTAINDTLCAEAENGEPLARSAERSLLHDYPLALLYRASTRFPMRSSRNLFLYGASTPWLPGMAAAALPLPYLDEIIAEYKI